MIRAAIEHRGENLIMSIRDQEAGSNVLKKEMPNGAEMTKHHLYLGQGTVVVLHEMLFLEKDHMVVMDSKTDDMVELVLGELPKDLPVLQALDRVLRLLSVGSKHFLWFLTSRWTGQ